MVILRVLLTVLVPISTSAQVLENYSDGNFTSDPVWIGHTESFLINENFQLQLDHGGPGQAYLSTASHVTNEAGWQFDLSMDFNPSARNFCRVYLISDYLDLSTALNGYYLLIGGSEDQVSLYRQDGHDHQEIIAGVHGITNQDIVTLSVKVTRGSDGQWELFLDTLQKQQYQLIGEVIDHTHQRANYFGFFCQFTTSRSSGFSFDNIKVFGKTFKDQQPPVIETLRFIDDQRIEIKFDEPVLIERPEQILVHGLGNPALIEETGSATWQFTFPFSFENQQEYVLELSDISDLFGNRLNDSRNFTFWKIQPADKHDVVITEVMADPVPSIQLPELEYLEILNRSDQAVNLKNWTLSDQTARALLPEYILTPGEYLVLYPSSAMASGIRNSLAVNPWPTLNNSGDLVSLADSAGNIIHFVDYRISWYRSDSKSHGGWSLELVDFRYPCTGFDNWTASVSSSGGTPGFSNSVATDNPDLTPPVIIGSYAENPLELKIYFDQPLGAFTDGGANLLFDPPLKVDTFFIESVYEPSISVRLTDPLEKGKVYQIKAVGFSDCNHNTNHVQGSTGLIGLAQVPNHGDLIINEVLFNPRPLGVRFIELYNRSKKPLNFKNWRFARWENQTLVDFSYLSKADHMIYPGEYRVFTTSLRKLKSHYPQGIITNVIEVDELPALGDKRGSLALLASNGQVLDSLSYWEDMHHALLFDQEGVSLERANPDGATCDVDNWYSGSELHGYASPGYQNSQYYASIDKDRFMVEPKLISPGSNGYQAYVRISFTLDQPGNSGTLLIFNRQGHLVRTLVRNSLLATTGTFQWDGTDDLSRRVPLGYYLAYFKVTNKEFTSRSWVQTIAVVPNYP